MSGRVFTADHPSYMAENLYNKIKSDIPLQESFCVLPSGEFSMWLGNKFSYEGELSWYGSKGSINFNTQ